MYQNITHLSKVILAVAIPGCDVPADILPVRQEDPQSGDENGGADAEREAEGRRGGRGAGIKARQRAGVLQAHNLLQKSPIHISC